MKKGVLHMNALDRAIAIVAPGTALRRAQSRTMLDIMAGSVSRTGASNKGSLGNWLVKRLNRFNEGYERERIADRADDLIANNSHAASIADSIPTNVVGGTGLLPQAKPAHKMLGITEDQAREVADQAEWAFHLWGREADAEGVTQWADICWQVVRSFAGRGEYLALPVYPKVTGRTFGMAIQTIDTRRLRTPRDLMANTSIRDGIKLGEHGQRELYYIADPDDGNLTVNLNSNKYRQIAPRRGHLPNIFHGFHAKEAEQVRGCSIFAPALKTFRDFDDYLDFELLGAIMAASFPVFIETPTGEDAARFAGATTGADGKLIKEYTPGQVIYGSIDQKPHILKSDRPGNSFPVFVETLLRAVGAAAGLPYEIVAKDFSKTNYSSARASLLEAWRLFNQYQQWLVRHFTQPVWEMVFEEAWLMGMIKLPAGAPDFYQARALWTNATWAPPKRGWIDPVKEVAAGKEALISNMTTMSDWYAEQGKDWEEELRQIARERDLMKNLGLTMADMPGFDLGKMATQPEP